MKASSRVLAAFCGVSGALFIATLVIIWLAI